MDIDPQDPQGPQPPACPVGAPPVLRLRLLGPLALQRGAAAVALPPSRKVRALVAYLALASHAVAREHLRELLWEHPSDPGGELRWCLSKARALLDEPGRPRLLADGPALRLDLRDAHVDVLELLGAAQAGLASLAQPRRRALAALFGGEFLQGLDIPRSAPWSAWLLGQRRRLRAVQAALLEHLARGAADPAGDEALGWLEQWLRVAPFDRRAHEGLLDTLARRGALREGDEHLAATARMFEAEGQDWTPLGRAWRAAKARQAAPALRMQAEAPAEPLAVPRADSLASPLAEPLTDPFADSPGGLLAGLVTVPLAEPLVELLAEPVAQALPDLAAPRRSSIAVMPFAELGRGAAAAGDEGGGWADGLAYDLITRLAKLRSLFVIAQGTVFALGRRQLGAEQAGRVLDVDYTVSGSVQRQSGRLGVTVQLAETRTARIVWADQFSAPLGEALDVLETLGNRIVASVASQVEAAERQRAILKPPQSLTAWEAHHRGLWHMYRFDRAHNAQARHFFQSAVRLDPGFARPWAGLSFTFFQDAFLGWGERAQAMEQAYRAASQGLMADDRDPAAHWALGRALWLRGEVDEALRALDSSVELSPNFALGHYTQAFVQAQSADPGAAIRAADLARSLSPYDPLLFAMLATRALALMRLGRHGEAAEWAARAAARPNAHVHILAIAAHCLALAGRGEEARAMAAAIQQRLPGYTVQDLLRAFHLTDDAATTLRGVAADIGLAG